MEHEVYEGLKIAFFATGCISLALISLTILL